MTLVELDVPEPGEGHVRIKVQACGICHSDSPTQEGQWPGLQFPSVPGHEIAGVIGALTRATVERQRIVRFTAIVISHYRPRKKIGNI